MSRSLHTDPRPVRAARRVKAPFERRGSRGQVLRRRGSPSCRPSPRPGGRASERLYLPRIIVHRPAAGRVHLAGKTDILELLRLLGEVCWYGLESIELAPAPLSDRLLFGQLLVPGRLRLYDQPPSPWMLPGRLRGAEQERMERAGALVEWLGGLTRVTWPDETLRDFMLFDVLIHEIGHHWLQHEKSRGQSGSPAPGTTRHSRISLQPAPGPVCHLRSRSPGEAYSGHPGR